MRFSVVTPSFNQLDWLELCIASVADQRQVELVEHIVCDGGSAGIKDFETRMLARFPTTQNYRLQFIIGPDTGMYDAINKGLRAAKGDVCSYLNCDEQLLPAALSTVSEYFLRHEKTDVVFGDTIVVSRDGEALCFWRPYVPSLRHLAGASLNTLSCATFFRHDLVKDGHFFEPKWKTVGDLRWITGLLEKGRSMRCLHTPLAAFTFLGENLGASAMAHEESQASRQQWGPVRCAFRRVLHGLRKLASGAYVRRSVTYDLFALSDPSVRRRFHSASLGWTWPGSVKSR
jgi:glycosyltransferase involved in cell wall biosynthesis